MKRYLLLALMLILAAAFLSACGDDTAEGEVPTKATIGEPVLDFEAKGLDGEMYKLSDYDGDVIFINFFASWCDPCREEIPHMLELAHKYGDQGFTLLFLTEDTTEATAQIIVDDLSMDQPVLLAGMEPFVSNDPAWEFYIHTGIPTTFIVAPDGKLVSVLVGSQSKETFEKVITDNLPE
ncbi:TlpA family protein disulfide reductase [bacterium]|nr:TlpA family protein disulfide reductase [bacterium]